VANPSGRIVASAIIADGRLIQHSYNAVADPISGLGSRLP
jgi:hypothetical protein